MRVTLLAAGSRGDTQPYLALGLALKQVGYTVRIAASETFKDAVEALELEFYPVGGSVVSKIAEDGELKKAMQADTPLKVIRSFGTLRDYAFALQRGFYDACAGSDAIIYHPGAAIGYFAARALGVPSILATPFPMTPTKAYPALVFRNAAWLGGRGNWLSHRLFERVLWLTSRAPVERFWKEKFGHAPEAFANPFRAQPTSYPTLVSCSSYVFPEPNDWPEGVHNTGYWFLDEADWQPPPELQAFLQRGAPPVYVGFGSLGDPAKAAATTELVIAALRRSGQRGILATGWSGMTKLETVPEDIFILESVPHSWLFPQLAAVVHHGGAGTTAAGLRSGVPSIVVPHANDQFAWGRRVYELGVGAKPLPKKTLTPEKLAAAIVYALTDEVKVAAKALGEKIAGENGAKRAAEIVVGCLEPERLKAAL